MPSIPQSLLWISLVVLWLFVLVPMLISKRDAVRRTSEVALATRVRNSGVARKLRKGPAAGHRSDPDWQPIDEDDEFDDAGGPVESAAVEPAESAAAERVESAGAERVESAGAERVESAGAERVESAAAERAEKNVVEP